MRKIASISTALLMAVASIGLMAPASQAAPTGVTGATLTWKVHDCAFSGAFVTPDNESSDTCFSIREDQTTTGDVARSEGGWEFSNGSGAYDAATGATEIDFTGSLRLGNINRGGYYIELADPTVSIDETGAGALSARLLVKGFGPSPAEDRGRVDLVELADVPDGTEWAVTPDWEGVGEPDEDAPLEGKQFAASFIDTLDASLRNWFRASSAAEATESRGEYNTLKKPAPVGMSFTETVWTPTLQVSDVADLDPDETRKVTVRGSGFDPAKQGNGVAGLYVVFGPNPADLADGYSDPEVFGAAQYLPLGPDTQGEFETTLTVTGNYTDGNGTTWSPGSTTLGVSAWAAHTRQTSAWDAFVPVLFTEPTQPVTPVEPVTPADPADTAVVQVPVQGLEAPNKVRKARVRKITSKRVKIKWAKPRGGTAQAADGYEVRISKPGKPRKFKGWHGVQNRKVTLKSGKRTGKYRLQIRAINEAGTSKKVTLRFRKR